MTKQEMQIELIEDYNYTRKAAYDIVSDAEMHGSAPIETNSRKSKYAVVCTNGDYIIRKT